MKLRIWFILLHFPQIWGKAILKSEIIYSLIFLFSFLLSQLFIFILGIQIAEFSMHGRHNIDSFLNHTEGIGPKNLTDFTICLRFNINFLKPSYNALVSYSTFLEDNSITYEVQTESDKLLLYMCKYINRNQVNYHKYLVV